MCPENSVDHDQIAPLAQSSYIFVCLLVLWFIVPVKNYGHVETVS